MLRLAPLLPLPLVLSLAACQTAAPKVAENRPSVTLEEPEPWRAAAEEGDAALLETIPALWSQALAETRRRYRRAVAVEGPLLEPDSRLPRAAPAPGQYRCRAVRIGARVASARPWSTSRNGFCFIGVEDGQLSFTSEIPALRFGGYLWEEKSDGRLIFLGAATPARARTAIAYGETAATNRVGIVERIGDFRYRLVQPTREGDARLVVIEMIAAPQS